MLDDLLQRRPYNAAVEFIDDNVASGVGDKVAFTDADRSLTYLELQQATFRFAAALRGLGLRSEERIALILPDSVDYPIAFWGAIRAGIVVIPLNTLLTAEQYTYILADSRVAALVLAAPFARKVGAVLDRLPSLRNLILTGGVPAEIAFAGRAAQAFDALLAGAEPACVTAPTLSDEVAFWMYTSGSSGDPKRAPGSAQNRDRQDPALQAARIGVVARATATALVTRMRTCSSCTAWAASDHRNDRRCRTFARPSAAACGGKGADRENQIYAQLRSTPARLRRLAISFRA